MLPLAFAPAWWVASALLIGGVLLVSLAPLGEALEVPRHVDKLEHLLAYAVLTVWFAGLLERAHYGWIALALGVLGLLIEVLQGLMDVGRHADTWDLAANLLGIGLGLVLAVRWTAGWAPRVEAWLARR